MKRDVPESERNVEFFRFSEMRYLPFAARSETNNGRRERMRKIRMVYMSGLHRSVADGQAPVPGVGFRLPWARCQADAWDGVNLGTTPKTAWRGGRGFERIISRLVAD